MLLANNWETLWADKPYEEDSEEYSQATAFRGIALALPEQAIISPTRIDGTSLPLFKCAAVPIGLVLSLCVFCGTELVEASRAAMHQALTLLGDTMTGKSHGNMNSSATLPRCSMLPVRCCL